MTDTNASPSAEQPDGTPAEPCPPLRDGNMVALPSTPPSAPAANPAGMVFGFFPDEFRQTVVKDALGAREANPGAARNRLDSRLRSAAQVRGFRNAAKAPPGQLATPVLDAIQRGDDHLAAAVLNLWVQANASLRTDALDTLRDAGLQPCAEALGAHFGGRWSFDKWLDLRDAFARLHPDADLDAAGLMLAVAADCLPLPPGRPDIRPGRLLDWMNELHALPHDAPEWADAEEFARSVSILAGIRQDEKREAAREARAASIRHTADEYADELRYLGIDLEPWLVDGVHDPLLTSRLADELAAVLARYRPIRPQAATRAEEAERAAARAELETAALEFPSRWEALPCDVGEPEDPGVEPAVNPEQGAAAPTRAELLEAHRELGAERDRLRTDNADLGTERDQLRADNADLAAERERLDLANASPRLAREQLDADNRRLGGELGRAHSAEEQWRLAYVEARRASATDEDAGEQAITSVAEALAVAERAFPDDLAISLNAKSDPDVPFVKPAEVFDALAWLATAYRRGPAAIAECCPGWFHKTDQSATTVGMYPDWYRTTYRGRTLEILEHIGKGASFDARSTIRIAFAWDNETELVVVGYVGRHQRNRQS